MKCTVVIACLFGVLLAPALADRNGKNGYHHEKSLRSLIDIGISTDSQGGSEAWKSVWDTTTGYVATKVFSKNTCIISRMDRRLLPDQLLPVPPQGFEGPRPYQLPPIGNRFIISRNRLQNLRPYGKRIQALCRGIPSYFAYPSVGSNFSMQDVSCLEVKINEKPVLYCA